MLDVVLAQFQNYLLMSYGCVELVKLLLKINLCIFWYSSHNRFLRNNTEIYDPDLYQTSINIFELDL